MKLRNLYVTPVRASELQLNFTVMSKVEQPSAALVRQLEEHIAQRTAALATQPPSAALSALATTAPDRCCTRNLLSVRPVAFTPLRAARSGAGEVGKYRVRARAVAAWPTDLRQWTHYCCARCGDRTHCSDATANGNSVSSGGAGGGGCRACGGLDSRRCEWAFSLLLEDATALLQAELWGEQAVRPQHTRPLCPPHLSHHTGQHRIRHSTVCSCLIHQRLSLRFAACGMRQAVFLSGLPADNLYASGVTLQSLQSRVESLLASRQLFDCWLWSWTQNPPQPHTAPPSAAQPLSTQLSSGSSSSGSGSGSSTQDSLAGLSDDEQSHGSGESESYSRMCRRYSIAHTLLLKAQVSTA